MASRKIEDLHQSFQPMVQELLSQGQKSIDSKFGGWKFFITDGFRSFEDQTKLYEQGRTTPGNIVTNAKAGQSAHNYGLAVDCAFQKDGKLSYDSKMYSLIYPIARKLGFELGADWKGFVDKPHFEHPQWEKISQGKEPEKGKNMSETALEACLRQHSELVTELDELKPKLKQVESELESCTRSKAQIVSERDKLKAIKLELVKLTGKEVDKAEDDVANALNHYYVTERNKEVDLEKQEKATTAPQKAVTEGAKEPVRIALSALVGFAVATAYTKYPFLGQIEPDQQVVIMAVVGVLTRTLNELIHNYGKNIGNDLLKTGFLDVSLVSYIQERLINSIKSSKNENSSN